jgi:hypothetical protein
MKGHDQKRHKYSLGSIEDMLTSSVCESVGRLYMNVLCERTGKVYSIWTLFVFRFGGKKLYYTLAFLRKRQRATRSNSLTSPAPEGQLGQDWR